MSTEHDDAARLLAMPALMNQFGERVVDDPPAVYYPPKNGDPVEINHLSVGALRVSEEIEGVEGSHERAEQMQETTLVIPQPFTAHRAGHFSILLYGDRQFSVREIQSDNPVAVTLVAERLLTERLQQRGQG